MAPGPPPTPTKILKLTGSWRGKKRGKEPNPKNKEPGCPSWLSKEAKAEWRRVMPQLKKMGLAAEIDRSLFSVYCQTWADYVEAALSVRAVGRTYVTDKGNEIQHPMVGVMNQTRKALLQFAQEFGIGAGARARIGAGPQGGKKKDAFDSFMDEAG